MIIKDTGQHIRQYNDHYIKVSIEVSFGCSSSGPPSFPLLMIVVFYVEAFKTNWRNRNYFKEESVFDVIIFS